MVMVSRAYPAGMGLESTRAHREPTWTRVLRAGAAWCAMPMSMRVARSGTGITRRLISGAGIACS